MSFGVFTDLYTIGHIEMPDCKWKRYLTSLDKWKFAVNCHVGISCLFEELFVASILFVEMRT